MSPFFEVVLIGQTGPETRSDGTDGRTFGRPKAAGSDPTAGHRREVPKAPDHPRVNGRTP